MIFFESSKIIYFMARFTLLATIIMYSVFHVVQAQDSSDGWHIYVGLFKDYYTGDLNVSVDPDGERRLYGSNNKFLDYYGWEVGVQKNIYDNHTLILEAGILLSKKRKIITNRLKETGLPFDNQQLYGIDAYYLSFPFLIKKNSSRALNLFIDIEPGLAIARFQRSLEMRKYMIPERFKDIWKYNMAIGPGLIINIGHRIKVKLKGRYYLRDMYNDYSYQNFKTIGWALGLSYKIK